MPHIPMPHIPMPHIIVNDPTALAAYIAIAAMDGGLIVLDGRPNAGKAWLAREMARQVGGTAVDAGDYLDRDLGTFLGALRIDDLRRALEDAAPPVLLSSVCARQVVEKLSLPVSGIVWVERTSLQRLEQARRDFALDREAALPEQSALSKEVEGYVAAHDARMRPDGVVYLDARG